jgi:hypothetical protein
MEIVRSQKKALHSDAVSTFPLYRCAPPLEVRLEDFELFAIDRLRGNRFPFFFGFLLFHLFRISEICLHAILEWKFGEIYFIQIYSVWIRLGFFLEQLS